MQALSEMKEAWREATVSAQTIMDKAVSLNSLIDKLDKALRDALINRHWQALLRIRLICWKRSKDDGHMPLLGL